MNRKTRAEERIEALDTSPEALAAAQVDAVRTERDEAVAKAEAERDGYLAALQRERAEFVNFRRRTVSVWTPGGAWDGVVGWARRLAAGWRRSEPW